MNLLTAELGLLMALGSGYPPTAPVGDETRADEVAPACAQSKAEDLSEVPAGEYDPLSVPREDGIVWYGTWEDAMAEMNRTGKPVLLHFGSPRRPKEKVCVPGAW
jgi:hypothetical protein